MSKAVAVMTPELQAAIERHAALLDQYGEDDPRTIEAAYWCLVPLPWPMVVELMAAGSGGVQ